jgi:hypothetical protein
VPNIFEQIRELIGKSDNNPLYKQLIIELGEEPEMQVRPNGKSRLLTFDRAQLGLISHLIDEHWILLGAGMAAKSNHLPDTIQPKDGRETVRQKLGQPVRSEFKPEQNSWEDTYILPEGELRLQFDADADEIRFWRIS